MRFFLCCLASLAFYYYSPAQQRKNAPDSLYYLTADRVFDGEQMHTGWGVLVGGGKILAAGEAKSIEVPKSARRLNYPGCTIMPGLIEGHGHLFLYPYNISSWDEQVLKETDALRAIRAAKHAEATLKAGFTTVRDLGTEGAGYADVALRQAIDSGIISGPRLLVAGRAIVATGAYGPKGYDADSKIMLGAQEADGNEVIRVVREQMGQGIDVVKVYADYYWGPHREDLPTFSEAELRLMAETAKSGGRQLVAHASTNEGMRRAIRAGVTTIEHGDELDDSTAQLMVKYGIGFFPTLAASESIQQYKGWKKGKDSLPDEIKQKMKSFQVAMRNGVKIGMGGDVGVFAHGDNVLEMELMEAYGMKTIDVLRAATSVNADALGIAKETGRIKRGLWGDIIVVGGNAEERVSNCRNIRLVMKGGQVGLK